MSFFLFSFDNIPIEENCYNHSSNKFGGKTIQSKPPESDRIYYKYYSHDYVFYFYF